MTEDGHHEVVLPLQQPVEVGDAVYGQVVDVSHNVPRPQACAVSWGAFHYSEHKGTSKTQEDLRDLLINEDAVRNFHSSSEMFTDSINNLGV